MIMCVYDFNCATHKHTQSASLCIKNAFEEESLRVYAPRGVSAGFTPCPNL